MLSPYVTHVPILVTPWAVMASILQGHPASPWVPQNCFLLQLILVPVSFPAAGLR